MKGWGRIRQPIYQAIWRNASWLHRYWPRRVSNPIFVVGCPRSGTTVLGDIFGHIPGYLYLNEPRYIWCQVNPRLDIWKTVQPIEKGVLCWDADDANPRDADRLSRWFALALFYSLRQKLVEKTPEHVFRLRWLQALFPEARFVHIIRHGRDVALSMAEAQARWFPKGYWETSRHYGIFRDYAAGKPELWDRLGCINEAMDNYPRSLFVWLCSVYEGRQAGLELGAQKYLEVRYEDLSLNPRQTTRQLYEFMGERDCDAMVAYAASVMHKTSIAKPDPDPGLTRAIAGEMLEELGYSL